MGLICAREHAAPATLLEPDPPAAAAEVGLLCRPCFERLRWTLDGVPALLGHVRAQVMPQGSTGEARVSGTRELPIPFNAGALEDADELFAALANEARVIGDELGVEVPAVLAAFARSGAAVDALATASTPADAEQGARSIVSWLDPLLPQVAVLDDVAGIWEALVPLVQQMHGRYPLEERQQRRQRPRLCPVCGEQDVVVQWEDGRPRARCRSCHYPMPNLLEVAGAADVP